MKLPVSTFAALLMMLAGGGFASATGPADQAASARAGPANVKLDYAAIKTREQAEALAGQGRLVRVLLFPVDFGGPDIPQNVTYIPSQFAEAEARIVATIVEAVEKDEVDRLDVKPEYRGDSFIPARLIFRAWHSRKPGEIQQTLELW
ncbi:hypothetical protein QO010_002443 [Caulobacter ginsengisoli]|uniref:Uncharacterized protein n=1 Tax=Caulobacter ginsengisoli TaxID=400775 RepID=A0ABU0IRQ3_9CAUL|nr:hypothetical protein [Caulobacter ginsengisoli]MDQ0464659.1 hypothetical protein [Caulobacter ginsengisoli]